MKKIITTLALFSLTTFIVGQGTGVPTIVLDPSVLEQATEQALATAKQLAIQEAQKQIDEKAREALTKVSNFIRSSGILAKFQEDRVHFLEQTKEAYKELGNMENQEVQQDGYKSIKKLQDENELLNKQMLGLTKDDEAEGNDMERLSMIKKLQEEQDDNAKKMYAKTSYYREYNELMNALNSTIKE